jgi:excisionase family DNA binding protein
MLYTITEAAALLKLHRNTISAMIRDGRLEAVDLNPDGGRRTWRVKVDGLLNGRPEDAAAWEDLKRRAGLE